jgi:hypothetical protein
MERIDSQLIGIGKLLSQSRFVVPPHQRPYAWGDQQIDDLYRDINDALKRSKNEEYFLGTVVLANGEDSRESIIDGQQRLVTTSILIAAIRDYFAVKGQPRAQDITQAYLSKRDIRRQEETAYLHLIPEDRDFFLRRVVLASTETGQEVKPSSQSQERIAAAIDRAAKFVDSIATTTQTPDDALLDLLDFIDQQAIVISVKVGDEANAFIIFEVLNDRGLDLSIADLMKNYVFRMAGDRLSEVSASWAKMMTAITEVAGEPDVKGFVRQAWIANYGLTREKQLYDALKKQITDKAKAVEYAQQLAQQAITYAALSNPNHERWKDYSDPVTEALEVFEMVGVTQIRPLLIAVFEKFDAGEVNKAVPMMVAWTVRFLICGSGGSGTLETYYSERAREVSSGTVKTAQQLYDAMKAVLPTDEVFEEAFANATVSKNTIAKFYLRVLEGQNKAGEGEFIVNPDPEKVNLEHVLPQTWTAEAWGHITQDQHRVLLKRLGNLALLSKRLNSKASNADFATKKPHFAASQIKLTNEIANEAQWTSAEIEARQARLAKLAVKAWRNPPR